MGPQTLDRPGKPSWKSASEQVGCAREQGSMREATLFASSLSLGDQLLPLAAHFKGELEKGQLPVKARWAVRLERDGEFAGFRFEFRGNACLFAESAVSRGCSCVLVPPAGFP